MSDKAIIGLVVAICVLGLGGGIAFVMRHSADASTASATAVPPKPVAATPAKTPPRTPTPTAVQPVAPATTTIDPRLQQMLDEQRDRVEQMRQENERLRQQLAAKSAATATTPPQRQEPSIEALAAYAKKLEKAFQAAVGDLEKEIDAGKIAGADVPKVDRSALVSFVNADLKKTDSLVNPVVGVVELKLYRSTISDYFTSSNTSLFTFTLAPMPNGGWRIVKAIKKVESVSQYPPSQLGGGEKAGDEADVTKSGYTEKLADRLKSTNNERGVR